LALFLTELFPAIGLLAPRRVALLLLVTDYFPALADLVGITLLTGPTGAGLLKGFGTGFLIMGILNSGLFILD